MLVLSRKQNERVVIDDKIVVVVVEIRGDKVRLGFEAPRDITIDRQEVHEAKLRDGIRREEADQKGEKDVDSTAA